MSNIVPLSQKQINLLVKMGGLAPSGANMQPWKVKISENIMLVMLDEQRSQASSFLDVDRLASIFALGCFARNVMITAAHLHLSCDITINPGEDTARFSASLVFLNNKDGSNLKSDLYEVIETRMTNRQISDGTLISDDLIDDLKSTVNNSDIKFNTISNFQKKQKIVDVLAAADSIRWNNDLAFNQMMQEFRWSVREVEDKRDGFDLKTLELPGYVENMLHLIKANPKIRKILPEQIMGQMTKPVLLGSSHLACMTVKAPLNSTSMFWAGYKTQEIWLKATKMGLSLQPWTTIVYLLIRQEYLSNKGLSESESIRIKSLVKEFREYIGLSTKEIPVFFCRLSHARPASARSLRIDPQSFTSIVKQA